MQVLAQKLMELKITQNQSTLPSSIFGTAQQSTAAISELNTDFKVGMWPAISQQEPLMAMGLMTVLAALLEQYRQITVYRLFAKLEGDASTHQWNISQSQFEFEDWHPETLDDNVGIWGTLTQEKGEWAFAVEVESDLSSSEDTIKVSRNASSVGELINLLPEMAKMIVSELGVEINTEVALYDTSRLRDETQVRSLLADWFQWELALLLSLWGRVDNILAAYKRLTEIEWRLTDDFGSWSIAQAVSRTLLPGFVEIETHLPPIEQTSEHLNGNPVSSIILGGALYTSGRPRQAIELLESSVSMDPSNPRSWILLADLYRRSGDFLKAVDTYQRAIEVDAVSVQLFLSYAQLLPLMEAAGFTVEEFILIEPDDLAGNYMTWEAIEAYESAFKHSREGEASILASQCLLLMEVNDNERLWETFQSLVRYDQEGDSVRQVVEAFYNLEDFEEGLDILEEATEQNPGRVDLRMNLALAYIAIDENEYALSELEQAYASTVDPQTRGEIERLMLIAENINFETAMSELADKINAGSSPTLDELDFLEDAMEKAPQYLDPYLLLAKGYLLREELDVALETLLDAQKRFPSDADILDTLAGVLWDTDEYEAAMGYLRQGLNKHPNHVPLLARMGQCMFDEGDPESARIYLARAEAINSKHPILVRVRSYIARALRDEEL